MSKFNIAEAKTHFSELVRQAMLGEEVIIARNDKPILKPVPLDKSKQFRKPGSGIGQIPYIAPDFDATPEAFNGYV